MNDLKHRADYLICKSAVIQESLRLSTAVPGGAPRIVPEPGVWVDGRFIPAGVRAHPESIRQRTVAKDGDRAAAELKYCFMFVLADLSRQLSRCHTG